jgi:mitochondrial transcription factor 1
MSEQFLAQILRCIPEQSWLFKFGRVPVNLILGERLWSVRPIPPPPFIALPYLLSTVTSPFPQRVSAPIADSTRCKLTVIGEATADIQISVPIRLLEPYDKHFHPTAGRLTSGTGARRIGSPFVAVGIKPLAKQVSLLPLYSRTDE